MRIANWMLLSLLVACSAANAQAIVTVPNPSSGQDACAVIRDSMLSSMLSSGGTVDARRVVGTQRCGVDMFSGVTQAITLWLGPAEFRDSATQTQPQNVTVNGIFGGPDGCCTVTAPGTRFVYVGAAGSPMWYLRNAHHAVLRGLQFDCRGVTNCTGVYVNSTAGNGTFRLLIEDLTIIRAQHGIQIGNGQDTQADAFVIRNLTIKGDTNSAGTARGIFIWGANTAQTSVIESVVFQSVHTGIWINKMEQTLRISSIDCGSLRGTANPTCIFADTLQDLHITDSRDEIDNSRSDVRFLRINSPRINAIVLERNAFNGSLATPGQPDSVYNAVDVTTDAFIVSIGNGGAGRARVITGSSCATPSIVSIGDRFPYNRDEFGNQHSGWTQTSGTGCVQRLAYLGGDRPLVALSAATPGP